MRFSHLLGHLSEHGLGDPTLLVGDRLDVMGQDRQSEEARAEDGGHHQQRVGGVLALGLLERRNAVGDGLHTGERDCARREGLQEVVDADGTLTGQDLLRDRVGVIDGRQVLEPHAIQADDDHQEERRDVDVGGRGEQRA